MANKIPLYSISKYRTELMGLATIFILICHSPINGIQMPKYLEYTIVQGQIGVDLFLFLSGMGLWFSLTKTTCGGGKNGILNDTYEYLFHIW